MFFSGQGPVFAGVYSEIDGRVGGFFDLGNMESFEIGGETTSITDTESKSGQRAIAARIDTENKFTISINLKEPNIRNIELMLRSSKVTNVGAAATDEINSSTGLVVGDFLTTKFQNISAVTVTDSAGTPATLTAGTHYEISSAAFGRIKLLNVTGHTQPYKVSYTYAARVIVPALNETGAQHFFLHMEGINTVDNTKFLAQMYKTRFSLPSAFAFLNDEFWRGPLEGELLQDTFRETDANYGKYWRIVNPL